MLTKEEVQSLQDQVPEEYKYIFKWFDDHTDYEDYITNGKPDLEKIKAIHLLVEEELADTAGGNAAMFYEFIYGRLLPASQRFIS